MGSNGSDRLIHLLQTLLAGLLLALSSLPASAATCTVNTTSDEVLTANSLAWCIANSAGGDTIDFNTGVFPTATPATILIDSLADQLPNITQSGLIIDASNAGVILDGGNIAEFGFFILGSNVEIRGFKITRFLKEGIRIDGGTGNVIGGDNTVGSGPYGRGNVIYDVDGNGIELNNPSSSNFIYGNYIGINKDNSGAAGNISQRGILVDTSHFNTIGGTSAGLRNVIANTTDIALRLLDDVGNVVQGNYIGTDTSGNVVPNNLVTNAVQLDASTSATLGGTTAGAGNVIGGTGAGSSTILVRATTFSTIAGNNIGIGANGSSNLGTGNRGIYVYDGSSTNTIGGTSAAAANYIGNATSAGIEIDQNGAITNNTTITGNHIGLDKTGSAAPNGTYGILIQPGGNNTTIGGTAAGAGNYIAGNTNAGVYVLDTTTTNIYSNHIGYNASLASVPNGNHGLWLTAGTINLGDGAEASSNVIGPNTNNGLFLDGATLNLDGTVDANGRMNFNSGTVNMGSAIVNLSANWITAAGATFNSGTSNVVFDGTTAQSITHNGKSFADATVSNTSAAVTFSDQANFSNLISTVGGSEIQFTAGTTYTISNALNVHGQTPATQVLLRSTAAAPYTLNVTGGVQGIYHADVQWGDAAGNDIVAFVSTNSGNNDDGGASPKFRFYTGIEVFNKNDTGTGSLREAVNNARSGDTISFDPTVFTLADEANPINVSSATLPDIFSGGVTIDASNVYVTVRNNGGFTNGLNFTTAGGNTVKGLRIDGFTNAIAIASGDSNVIGGDNTLGTGPWGEGNALVGNTNGLYINSLSNTVTGNFIGNTRTAAVANTGYGISLAGGGDSNIIGGTTAGTRNIISGNSSAGVFCNSCDSTELRGNYIGLNEAGTAAIANGIGVLIQAGANGIIIGGTTAGYGNTISGNSSHGIAIDANGAAGVTVTGNIIGLNPAGTAALSNAGHGIQITSGSSANTIGGNTAAARNVISGNTGAGIAIDSSNSSNVTGNYIGTDATGTLAIPNTNGIAISGSASSNALGGTGAGDGNVISGNSSDGINISGSATATSIAGNYIGLNAAGTNEIPNNGDGVDLSHTSGTNTVGGATAAHMNYIAGNDLAGIRINGAGGTTSIYGNTIGQDTTATVRSNSDGLILTNGTTNLGSAAETNLISGNTGSDMLLNGPGILNLAGTIDVGAHVTVSGGTINLNAATMNIGGNWSNTATTVSEGTSTVNLIGTADQNLTTNGQPFYHLTVNNTGANGVTDNIIVSGTLDTNGTLTITDGDLDIGSNNPAVATAGDVSIGAAGSVDVTGRTSTWTFDGTSLLTDATGVQDLERVVLNGTSVTLGSSIRFNSLTIPLGTFSMTASGYILELDGTGTPMSVTDTFQPGTSTVRYIGSGTATSIATTTYDNLEISPAAATTYSMSGSLTLANRIAGNLTVGANATLDSTASNHALATDGAIINNGTLTLNASNINIGGDWNNTGTVNAGTSLVTLDGAGQNITGSTTFYNLSKSVTTADTLTFANGTTQFVTNNLLLSGASGQLLSLLSDSAPLTWSLDVAPAASHTIQYINVSNSIASNETLIAVNSTDGGNNTNWIFPTAYAQNLIAEITPNNVELSATTIGFTVDALPTFNVSDIGMNYFDITLPAGFTNFSAPAVNVGGAALTSAGVCGTPAAGQFCYTIAGQVMNITLGDTLNNGTPDPHIDISFTADAPAVTTSAAVTVDGSHDAFAIAALSAIAGNADADAGDLNSLTLSVDSFAVSSAVAEILPGTAASSGTQMPFTLVVLPTMSGANTGVNELTLTLPAGFNNQTVTGVSVSGTPQPLDATCPALSSTYCFVAGAGSLNIQLGSKLVVSLSDIRVDFLADTPVTTGPESFSLTIDDNTTVAVPQTVLDGDADAVAANSDSLTINTATLNAVTSITAEINPPAVGTGTTANLLTLSVQPTLAGNETGVNQIDITAPASFSGLLVDAVRVAGSALTNDGVCGIASTNGFCYTIAGQNISVELGTASTGSLIEIDIRADASATAIAAQNFAVSVDDNRTATPGAQVATAADSDGTPGNNDDTDIDIANLNAVSSVVAEISPNLLTTSSTANSMTIDILPTIGLTETGINNATITLPAGFINFTTTNVSVDGIPLSFQGAGCGSLTPGQYCQTIAGQDLIIGIGDKLTTSGSNLRIIFTVDAPATSAIANFGVTVDDLETVANPAQSATVGDADGISNDANSLSVNVITGGVSLDLTNSVFTVSPSVVAADGSSTATLTVTLLDSNNNPVTGRGVTFSSSRGVTDTFIQPVAATDATGTTSGSILSLTPGEATLSAVVTPENQTLPVTAKVAFTRGKILSLVKTSSRPYATTGDIVNYTIVLRNSEVTALSPVKLYDWLPAPLKLVPGSVRVNGELQNDPAHARNLVIDLGIIPGLSDTNGNGIADRGESGYVEVSYSTLVRTNARPGKYLNRAVARDCVYCDISNTDQAELSITLDPIFDQTTVLGKVFADTNRNGHQDLDESGVGGAVVILDTGATAITDKYGRYHFNGVEPGSHAVKLNLLEMKEGTVVTTDDVRVVQMTPGTLATANFGVIEKDSQKIAIGEPPRLGVLARPRIEKESILVTGSIRTFELLVNGKPIQLPTANLELLNQDLDQTFEIRGGKLSGKFKFRLNTDRPENILQWTVNITREPDNILVRQITGQGKPPRIIYWDGKSGNGSLVQSGEKYAYQAEVHFDVGNSIHSGKRLFAINEQVSYTGRVKGQIFAPNTNKLSKLARDQLKVIAMELRKHPDQRIVIEGVSRSKTSGRLNTKRSRNYANAVREHLIQRENIPATQTIVAKAPIDKPRDSSTDLPSSASYVAIKVQSRDKLTTVNLTDQYRQKPVARINGDPVKPDRHGRFITRLKSDQQGEMLAEITNDLGASARIKLPVPGIQLQQPAGDVRAVYEENTENYWVTMSGFNPDLRERDIVMVHLVKGRTAPGNRVELDGEILRVDKGGEFSKRVPLHEGNNTFGVVAIDPQGNMQHLNVHFDVSYRARGNQPLEAIPRIPHMEVYLPGDGAPLRSSRLNIKGSTEPGNKIEINDKPINVDKDGSFRAVHALKKGDNQVLIRVTDPRGNTGELSRKYTVTDNQLFLLAFAEGRLHQFNIDGSPEAAGFGQSSGYYSRGRLAYYLKGYIKGKYLIRSALDTGVTGVDALFSELDQEQTRILGRELDPEQYYPVYGDQAQTYDETLGQSKFFVELESKTLDAVLGKYTANLQTTGLAVYQRKLYGVKTRYKLHTKDNTPLAGDATAFAATARQMHIRNEIAASGGAIYLLSHRSLLENSETVKLIVRDQHSDRVLATHTLNRDRDYEIRYQQGRIIFHRPISPTLTGIPLIDQTAENGNPIYIRVDYDTRDNLQRNSAYGGEIELKPHKKLTVGAIYVKDELAIGRYQIRGVSSRLQLTPNTHIGAGIADSTGTGGDRYVSQDSGISFEQKAVSDISAGSAWKFDSQVDIGEFMQKPGKYKVNTYYQSETDGFQSDAATSRPGNDRYGASTDLKLTERDVVSASIDVNQVDQATTTDDQNRQTGMVQYTHRFNRWALTSELRSLAAEDQNGSMIDEYNVAALRSDFSFNDRTNLRAEHQQTLTGEPNTRSGLGVDYRLNKLMSLTATGRMGDRGNSLEGGAFMNMGKHRLYATQRMMEADDSQNSTTVVGAETRPVKQAKVYTEQQWQQQDNTATRANLIGSDYQWRFLRYLTANIYGEYVSTQRDQTTGKRHLVGSIVAWNDKKRWDIHTRWELQRDRGYANHWQGLNVTRLEYKLGRDYALIGHNRYSQTRSLDTLSELAQYSEQGLGVAYRPVSSTRINALMRYVHLAEYDLRLALDNDFARQAAHIVSTEWSWFIMPRYEWVEKLAYKRNTLSSAQLPSQTVDTLLAVQHLNYEVRQDVLLGAEYRIRSNLVTQDAEAGWLVDAAYRIKRHLRIGAGYNFTRFSDNALLDDNYDASGWFIRLQGLL